MLVGWWWILLLSTDQDGENMSTTLHETDIAHENRWLEDDVPFRMPIFAGVIISFRECTYQLLQD